MPRAKQVTVASVIQLRGGEFKSIRRQLDGGGFSFFEKRGMIFQAKVDGTTVNLYPSGKLMVQGNPITLALESGVVPHVGTDEAGKGDFFGYLVVAGVYVDSDTEPLLRALGVRDSKEVSDDEAVKLAARVTELCPHDVVKISPGKYNQLYGELKNLNRLLAWAHARVIENMLSKVSCGLVVSDQFGDRRFLEERLMSLGRKAELVQKPHAEEDTAVAAASLVARSVFLMTLKSLSAKYGVALPKGSVNVFNAAREMTKKHGASSLEDVAKTQFKVAKRL